MPHSRSPGNLFILTAVACVAFIAITIVPSIYQAHAEREAQRKIKKEDTLNAQSVPRVSAPQSAVPKF